MLAQPAGPPALVFLPALPFCWPVGGWAVPGAALRTAFTLMGSTCMQKLMIQFDSAGGLCELLGVLIARVEQPDMEI